MSYNCPEVMIVLTNSRWIFLALLVILYFSGCSAEQPATNKTSGEKMAISLTSSAFAEGKTIPTKYSSEGDDISPPLAWSGVPKEAKSLVLICDDPDAPMGTWVHWVIYNLPPTTASLAEAVAPAKTRGDGSMQGYNSAGKVGYQGPMPPSGTHRYFFRLYALDKMLELKPGATRAELDGAMKGHILAQGQLMGTYTR